MSFSLDEFLSKSGDMRHHALLLLGRAFAVEGISPEAVRAIALTYCGINFPACENAVFWDEAVRHPDFCLIDRERSILRIEEVEGIRKLAVYPPNVARRRLFLIDRCERLNVHAANSLLKVLEEPGVKALFLFTAKSLSDVISTIVSRCQRVPVRFSEERRVSPREAFEEDDWRWLSSLFAGCGARGNLVHETVNTRFPLRELRPSVLAEILERAQSMGKRYERSVLQDGLVELLVDALRRSFPGSVTTARYVQADLKRWRDSEAFHPSSEFWLSRIFLRFV